MNQTKTHPEAGQLVKVRTRTWLVEGVEAEAPSSFTVDLACLDDDAQGEKLSVAWELELDGSVVSTEAWKDIGKKGFKETEKTTLAAAGGGDPTVAERGILDEMSAIAERARLQPDSQIQYRIQWVRENLCAGASLPRDGSPQANAPWQETRLIIFTEWDDTKRYIEQNLKAAISGTDRWEERIEIFHGPTPPQKKDDLKRAFNTPPDRHPVRILICTDAAREALNLQGHCHHLIHFDVPLNPARMEQRNDRVDRKLQPAPVVYCRYFFYTQRPEDRVLRVLARKVRASRMKSTGTMDAQAASDDVTSLREIIAEEEAKPELPKSP